MTEPTTLASELDDHERLLKDHQDRRAKILDMAKSLELYSPLPAPPMPRGLPDMAAIVEAKQRERYGGKPSDISTAEYGAWQLKVTGCESANAGRLQALMHGLMECAEMLVVYPEARDIRIAEQGMRALLTTQWRVADVPATRLEARGMAQAHCRRYDVMPREWRGL